jgi:hypothetical protein
MQRLHDMKKEVLIYDDVNLEVPLLAEMNKMQLAGYKAIENEIKE